MLRKCVQDGNPRHRHTPKSSGNINSNTIDLTATATLNLAQWASNLQFENLPSPVISAARLSLYNYIGCAIAGSNHPAVSKAYDGLSPLFGNQSTSTLLGKGERVDLQHATLLNGIASHVHDYDDTHLETIIHPAGPVASALLAFAEYVDHDRDQALKGLAENDHQDTSASTLTSNSTFIPITSKDLLCALVAGIETSCKLGLSVWPSHYDIGWHITSTTGSIGAGVAVGNLLRFDTTTMAHAIGIASVQVTGLREMFGSDTSSFHPGRAAQNGVVAALLARRGYTSSTTALEAKRGWANVVLGDRGERGHRLDEYIGVGGQLGEVWEIEKNAFKPFPCGIVCHPAIDACIQLHPEFKKEQDEVTDKNSPVIDISAIAEIEQRVHPLVLELTSKRTPRDGLEAKFSVFHGCAVGLLFGKAGPAQYADRVVTSAEVIELRDKIDATADRSVKADEAFVVVHLKDGRQVTRHVRHAVGSLEVPMSQGHLTEKFIDQVSLVVGVERAKEMSELAWKLGDAECLDVMGVLRSL